MHRLLATEKNMRQKNAPSLIFRFILVLLPLLATSNASAFELGSMALKSRLGAPFRASIPVTLSGGETLDASCLHSRVPDSGNSLPQLIKVRLTVEKINGQLQILIKTDGPVNDPAFLLGLSIGCGHNLERDYPVLLDPPETVPAGSSGAPVELGSATAFTADRVDATTRPMSKITAPAGEVWEVPQDESPQSLVEKRYPGDPVLQNRMLAAMVLDNLGVFPDGVIRPLPPGTRLRLSNPQRIATTPRSRFEKAIQKALGKRSGDKPAGTAAPHHAAPQVFQVKVDGGLQKKQADGNARQKMDNPLSSTDSDDLYAINLSLQNRLQETDAQLKQLLETERELSNQLAALKKVAIKPPAPPLPANDGLTLWQAGLGGGLLTAAVFGVALWLWRRKTSAKVTLLRRLQERNSTF
jgi:Tfp pilus assembly protein FimV